MENNTCPDFLELMLQKLKDLKNQDELFVDEKNLVLTPFAAAVVRSVEAHLRFPNIERPSTEKNIEKFMIDLEGELFGVPAKSKTSESWDG